MADLTFAVADLHGSYDLLAKALAAIEAYAPADGGGARTIVFLGDYIDRGPDSRRVVEQLMRPARRGWRSICLKGNHEDMMCEALARRFLQDWMNNGGRPTLASFAGSDPDHPVPPAVVAWADALPLMHVDVHRIYVHAGVDPAVPLDRQDENDLLWRRDQGPQGHGERHVVHGHTPHVDGPRRYAGRTNLDTLAWKTGRLVVGVFDDAIPGGPVDLVEVRRGSRRDADG